MSAIRPLTPEWEQYFMRIAFVVMQRAACCKGSVGAVIAKQNRVVSTGYNGTPYGMTDCWEDGCTRCKRSAELTIVNPDQPNQKEPEPKKEYCICVHAEQNALLAAAQFGISVEGATMYVTRQPCFGCAKEMLQAKIASAYFVLPGNPIPDDLEADYQRLRESFPHGVRLLQFDYPHNGNIQCPFENIGTDQGTSTAINE
jgi:dCMP deaminase